MQAIRSLPDSGLRAAPFRPKVSRIVTVALLVAGLVMAFSSAASAYTQYYEGWRGPTGEISTRGLHSWAYTQTVPIPMDSHITCSYMYNGHLDRTRGGSAGIRCEPGWASINWGPTADAWYSSWGVNGHTRISRYLAIHATT